MKLLFVGEIGCGKSTVVNAVMDHMAGPCCGLKSVPLDPDDRPKGFRLVSLHSKNECEFPCPAAEELDRTAWKKSIHQAFNRFGVEELRACRQQNAAWLILDELGVVEQGAEQFIHEVKKSVAHHRHVLMVIQKRAWEFWSDQIDLTSWICIRVTEENRDAVAHTLSEILTFEKTSGRL